MERLDLVEAPRHQSVEAAIHLARYALALAHCRGRHVLDIACGEGYGSILMKLMGAKRVDGVDISEDAITKARQYCRMKGVRFRRADALRIDKLFPKDTFDLVVSIETMEHVADAEAFLRAIKAVARDDATIILTCPNDHWYYPDERQSNPYHKRKYTLDEFQRLTTRILGRKVSWGLGTGVLGFGTVSWPDGRQGYSKLARKGWLEWKRQDAALFVPTSIPSGRVSKKNCSYFVGVWGPRIHSVTGSTVFPLSMNKFIPLIDSMSGYIDNTKLRSPVTIERFHDQDATAKSNNDGTTPGDLTTLIEHAEHRAKTARPTNETEILLARLPALEAELGKMKADFEKREAELQNALLNTKLLHDARRTDAETITSLSQTVEALRIQISELEQEARKYRLQAAVLIKETEILQARLPALEAELATLRTQNPELAQEARKYRLQAAVLIKETEILQAQLPALEAELVSQKANFELLSQEHKRLLIRWNMVMAVPRRIVPPAWRPPIKRALLKIFSRNVNR